MSTSHPLNTYTMSQSHRPPPPPSQHQPYPITDDHPPPPHQIALSDPRDSAPSDLERKTRPATITELAEKARKYPWDPNKSLKYWLHTTDLARKSAKQHALNGDYQRSFVQFARVASMILEKMPTHKDYDTLLTSDQRNNLIAVRLSFFPHHATPVPAFVPAVSNPPCGLPSLLFPVISPLTKDPSNLVVEPPPSRTLCLS